MERKSKRNRPSWRDARRDPRGGSDKEERGPGLSAKHLFSVGPHMDVEGGHLIELMATSKFYIVFLNVKTQLLNH